MSTSKTGIFFGAFIFFLLLAAAEIFVRTPTVSRMIAFHPSELVNEDIFSAKMNALSEVDTSTAVLIGDSVAFGQTMEGYGFDDWENKELTTYLNAKLKQLGAPLQVANYASNGLTPADIARVVDHTAKAGADAVILVVGVRGFSDTFLPEDDRYTYNWGPKKSDRSFMRIVNKYWKTKPAAEFGLTALLGGPLNSFLTRVKARCYTKDCDTQGTPLSIQILQMKRRLANVTIDPQSSYQAAELSRALKSLDAAAIPAIVVYATENPSVVSSFIEADRLNGLRAEIETLVKQSGERHVFLPFDPNLNEDLYVDHMHLTPDGYKKMADRLAPVLAKVVN